MLRNFYPCSNPTALRRAKTLWSFGPSECSRVKGHYNICNILQAYYGGEARCDEQAVGGDVYDPTELVCGGCSDVSMAQVKLVDLCDTCTCTSQHYVIDLHRN